jgi:hypothetical protein
LTINPLGEKAGDRAIIPELGEIIEEGAKTDKS